MKFQNIVFLFLFFCSTTLFSQVIDSSNFVFEIGSTDLQEIELVEEYSPSEEELEMQVDGDEARRSVILAEDLLGYVNILKAKDSLVYKFLQLREEEASITYNATGVAESLPLSKKFDVVFYPDTRKLMYIREMILNDNQAWDFIYERIFDENGILRMFIRQYSTFNSGCAEVAFERSEYFFNENSEQVKKTYEIYDAREQELDASECWMEREEYQKYKNLPEYLEICNIPLESIPQEGDEKIDLQQEEQSEE